MNKSSINNAKEQFNLLFTRIVSFSSLTSHKKLCDLSYKSPKAHDINPDKISSGIISKDPNIPDSATFDQIRSMPNNAFKVLYMNMEQIGMLAKRLVVFLSDYGTGDFSRSIYLWI